MQSRVRPLAVSRVIIDAPETPRSVELNRPRSDFKKEDQSNKRMSVCVCV